MPPTRWARSGFFDSDPRIVGDRVDCMTWVQWVLALAYAGNERDPQPWLDAIRYYNAHVGFDTRKHYVDRWLTLDPGPLVPIQSHSLSVETERIDLALEDFRLHHQYPCELYQSEMNHIRLDVISQEHLIEIIHDLAPVSTFYSASQRIIICLCMATSLVRWHRSIPQFWKEQARVGFITRPRLSNKLAL